MDERRTLQAQFERRLDTMEGDISEMKHAVTQMTPLMNQIVAALTTLAKIEERAEAHREALAASTKRLDNHSDRLKNLEAASAEQTANNKWLLWITMAVAGGIGELALHYLLGGL